MCFTLFWLVQLLVQLIIIVASVMIARILIPWLLSLIGVGAGVLMQVINIIIWAVVTIAVIWLVYDLVACLWTMRLPRY